MWGALMANDFEISLIRHIKGTKEHVCHLCDRIISKGAIQTLGAESINGKVTRFRAHDSCMNLMWELCNSCKENDSPCKKTCKECFKERGQVITDKEVSKLLKPVFTAFPGLRNIKVSEYHAIGFDYKGRKLLEINMFALVGDFFSMPKGIDIYRDWYKRKD
jgi:hypothetical protein|nr:MAG TPA: hypothetical protein [Caudoviricetes sp.]